MRAITVLSLLAIMFSMAGCSSAPPPPSEGRPLEGNRIPNRPTVPPPTPPK